MKSLTVAYHDEDKNVFGRVQVIAEPAFPQYASRGFVEVEVDENGKLSKIDRGTEPEAEASQNQALLAKASADAANKAADEAVAKAEGKTPEPAPKPAPKPTEGGKG